MANDREVEVKITADASEVAPEVSKAETPIESLEQTMENLRKSMVADSAAIQSSWARLSSGITTEAVKAEQAIKRPKEAVDNLKDAIDRTPSSAAKFAANMNLMRQGADVFTTAAMGMNPAMIAIQQGPQILDALISRTGSLSGAMGVLTSPAVLAAGALTAVGAAAAYVGMQMHAGREEQIAIANSLQVMGRASGITEAQVYSLGQTIADSMDIAAGPVRELEVAIARTGRVSAENLDIMTEGSLLFARAMGVDAKDAMNTFIPLTGDTYAAALKLNESFNVLTESQLEQIRTLQEHGNKQEAVRLAMEGLVSPMRAQQQNLGTLESAWRGLSNAISGAIDEMMSWGRVSTDVAVRNQQELAKYEAAQKAGSWKNVAPEGRVFFDFTADDQKRLDMLRREKQGIDDNAAAAQKYNKAISDGNKAAQLEERLMPQAAALRKNKEDQVLVQDRINKGIGDQVKNQQLLNALVTEEKEIRKKQGEAINGKATKTKGPSQVSIWQQELQEQLVASRDFFGDQTQAELKFWQGKLSLTKQGTREWLGVQARIYEAEKSLARAAYADQIAQDRQKIAAARDNWSQQAALWDGYLSDVKAKYAEDSAEYRRALQEKEAAFREHADRMRQMEMRAIEDRMQLRTRAMEIEARAAQENASLQERLNSMTRRPDVLGQSGEYQAAASSAQARYQLEVETARRIYEVQLNAVTQQMALSGQTETQLAALNARKLQLEQQYQQDSQASEVAHMNEMANLAIQQAMRVQQRYMSVATSITSAWSQSMKGIIQGTQTWGDLTMNIADAVLGTFLDMIAEMVARWIVAELTKTQVSTAQAAINAAATSSQVLTTAAISSLSSLLQIKNAAAVAAANAFASTAAIPIIGPALAPAAALAADASVMAFSAQVVASAAGGYDIPAGVNPVTQLHAEEMVLPSYIATPMRSALKSGGTLDFGGDGGAKRQGDAYVSINAVDGPSVKRLFQNNAAAFKEVIMEMMRDGSLIMGGKGA